MDTFATRIRRPSRTARTDRRAERRRLARQDVLSSRLGELHAISDVLARAGDMVSHGWIQGGWFTVATSRGEAVVMAYDVGLAEKHPVTGACLVGAVVHAGGGPDAAESQLVQRTLDLTWHAVRGDLEPPATLCPSPAVRKMRLRDLTRWNDAPGRTQADVVEALAAARELSAVRAEACRAERDALIPAP